MIRFCHTPILSGNRRKKNSTNSLWQKELGLLVVADVPLFGTISRLAEQKGVDIQLGALEEMLSTDMQFVLLGSGALAYERGYQRPRAAFSSQSRGAGKLQ